MLKFVGWYWVLQVWWIRNSLHFRRLTELRQWAKISKTT